jgi:threonylcarbamoyladenosine tRNA methylthiotransferase MtaB
VASFYIENFGCRATQADGAALERQFLDRGLARAGASRDAEIVVLNTCTVTEGADKDARASIRRLQRVNPNCRILVTGCYAQRAPEELTALPGVTWVVGNSHKHQAAEIATGSARGFVPLSQIASAVRSDSAPEGAPDIEELAVSLKRYPDTKRSSSANDKADRESETGLAPVNRFPEVIVGDIFAHTELLAAPVFEAANERTRPNLKVQDGCDNRCSFCVIPYVRGQSRSLPRSRVIAEVRTLVEAGYREVVISGINLGRWGRDLVDGRWSFVVGEQHPPLQSNSGRPGTNDQRLESLIHSILNQTSLEKLRISSVEPMDWSDELIELVASSGRIAKHAHVPMQSGSDAVLRRMHRKYRPWHYREKILKIRSAMPTAAIGADVMVGFPAETEAEFEETRSMIEELPFTYLHVFTYSARPGTPAAERPKQVPVAVARKRNGVLRELVSQKKRKFMQSLLGTNVEAITLQSGGEEFTEALTDNYLKLKISGHHPANRWMNLEVDGIDGEMLVGKAKTETPWVGAI